MPRPLRADYAGAIYHALNRGNARNKIFFKQEDFEALKESFVRGWRNTRLILSPTSG